MAISILWSLDSLLGSLNIWDRHPCNTGSVARNVHRREPVPVIQRTLLPIAKAHLPFSYSNTEQVLVTLQQFDAELKQAMDVVRIEVINRFAQLI